MRAGKAPPQRHSLPQLLHPLLVSLLWGMLVGMPHAYAQSGSRLLSPSAIAYDAAGNLFIADTNRNQVFEATLGGQLVLVAGNGVQGFAGDGGPATAALLNAPAGLAIAADGTVYIADTGNARIRAVVGGTITTFAGTGLAAFTGDGGPATAASFHRPTALALDSGGALLVCDTDNHRLRRVTASLVTTLAGSGVQGFAGDGGPATFARLDSPAGVAAAPDGRIFLSDTHNDRLRVLAADGTISTFAGTGVRSFSGDGGPATLAHLALPQGLALTSAGTLLVADGDNQRLRAITPGGTISSVAGTGVQGNATDGAVARSASLNTPRAAALSIFGYPTVADAPNGTVRVLASDGNLYLPAALATGRISTVSVSVPSAAIYGQTRATVQVTGSAGTPQGTVQLSEGTTPLVSAPLTAGQVAIPLPTLSAGAHTLSAAYTGDGLNPAADEASAVNVSIGQAPLLATANGATMMYGELIPALTGTLTGVLPQDAGQVFAAFAATAPDLAPPGSYPIVAALAGPAAANYSVSSSPQSDSLQIVQATTNTVATSTPQTVYAGLPVILTARIAPPGRGTPTGTVTFLDGSQAIGTAAVMGGAASWTELSPSAQTHVFTAAYGGDTDFLGSTSAALSVVAGALPDFTIGASDASKAVSVGSAASFGLSITANPAPFTGAVTLAISGLPAGAIASFSPAVVVPGAGSAAVTLTVQTAAASANGKRGDSGSQRYSEAGGVLALALVFMLARKRPLRGSALALLSLLAMVGMTAGCGDRVVPEPAQASHTYPLVVTGTSTNLAGAVITHTVALTLVVQ